MTTNHDTPRPAPRPQPSGGTAHPLPPQGPGRDAATGAEARPDEFEFMVAQRRNLLTGVWAAELLGLLGQAAHDYARTVMRHDPEHRGNERFVTTLYRDLKGQASRADIRRKMAHLLSEARSQLRRERNRD